MFWNIFFSLCAEKGRSPNAVAKELSIASGTVTAWKNGKVPHHGTLLKLASYFGVTVDYLLGNEPASPASPASPAENMVIYHRDGKTVTKKFSKEQMEMLAKMIDAIPEEEDG